MLPLPPDGMSPGEKKQWQQNEWANTWQPKAKAVPMPPAEAKAIAPAALPKVAKARQQAGPNSSSARGTGRAYGLAWPKWAKLPKTGSGMVMLLCAAILSGQNCRILKVSRLSGAVAQISEAVSSTASRALGATTELTSSAADLVVAVATNTLSLGDNFWHGVDLYNITASRCSGQFTVDSSAIVAEWLDSNKGATLLPCITPDSKLSITAAAESVGLQMPQMAADTEELRIIGSYKSSHNYASLLFSGQLRIVFDSINVIFLAEWANPLWATFGCPQELERPQITLAVQDIADKLPSKSLIWEPPTEPYSGFGSWLLMQGEGERLARWLMVHTFA